MSGSLRDYPGEIVRLSCEKCGRSGQYRKQTLIERHDADMRLPDLREENVSGSIWARLSGIYVSSSGATPGGRATWIANFRPKLGNAGRNAMALDVLATSTSRRPLYRFRSGTRLQPVKFFQSPRQRHPPRYRTTMNFRRRKCTGIYLHVFEPKTPPSNFLGVPHDKTPQTATKSRET